MKIGLGARLGLSASWSPYRAFGNDMRLGLDASIGASNDGTTFTWRDRSRRGNNATEATAGKLPTIVTDGGLPAISLAQSTGRAKITYAAQLAQPCTIWVVVNTPSVAGSKTNVIFDGIDAGNTQRSQFAAIGGASTSALRMFAGTVVDSATFTGVGAYRIYRITYGATDAITVDGSAAAFSSGDAGANVSNGMYLGADNSGTTTLEAGPLRYRSIHVIGRATTAYENRRMDRYLSSRWAIPLAA